MWARKIYHEIITDDVTIITVLSEPRWTDRPTQQPVVVIGPGDWQTMSAVGKRNVPESGGLLP
jgi:hypothetical protein